MNSLRIERHPSARCWRTLLNLFFAFALILSASARGEETPSGAPNVLFIALDDLNDWVGCLGGHPQTRTPNLDRLAASGVLFTNAHCTAPACNPSRTAIFTGRAPNRSGLYDNRQKMREILPDAVLLPQYFRNHGYSASGSGKMLHYFIDADSWDQYYPDASSENPFPKTYYPEARPVSLPRGGPWQYVETDWAALDVSDEQFGGDWLVSQWIGEQLHEEHPRPFFLACGIYRPHEPWFVPEKYFEPFPLESIELPPGYREDDLDDVPPAGVRAARNRYFAHIQEHDQWRQGVQAYLASIHFADAMLGRVLDALDSSPYRDNTIVVLWSDHGWQLGEKEHWQKFTPWRAVTRVPLIVRVPEACSVTLPAGTPAGRVCNEPVNLLSLFPTLVDLCGLPPKEDNDGASLRPLLGDTNAAVTDSADKPPRYSITYLSQPNSYAVSGQTHRYIHYANGDEELYDVVADPYEWTNISDSPKHTRVLQEYRDASPTEFAKRIEPKITSLGKLDWKPLLSGDVVPSSIPDGSPFPVYFRNQSGKEVELFWMDRTGDRKSYGLISHGKQRQQRTRPGAVWMIAVPEGGEELGFFRVDDRSAQAIIPETAAELTSDSVDAK